MKRRIAIVLPVLAVALLMICCFAACGNEGTVPTYQGMTISRTSATMATVYSEAPLYLGDGEGAATDEIGSDLSDPIGEDTDDVGVGSGDPTVDQTEQGEDTDLPAVDPHTDHAEELSEEIEDLVTITVETDDEVKYYVRPNEDFIIAVHISNPDNFEIQSFTLNGNKYANYMFEQGSTMELLLLKVTALATSGYTSYSIDAIKYIDGTEIKDVDMSKGEKSIKAGVAYTNPPTAAVTNLDLSTTSFSLDVNVTDVDGIIGNNVLGIYLSDGEKQIAAKPLQVGANAVTFDDLTMSTVYEFGVVTAYDLVDGNDLQAHWLLTDTVTTLGAYSFRDVVTTQEGVSFALDRVGDVGTITSISLYDAATQALVQSGDAESRAFTGLLSDHTYHLYVDFSYLVGGETVTDWVAEKGVKTVAKAVPSFEIESLVPTQTSFDYEINVTDADKVGTITKIELLHGNDDLVVVEDLTSREFTGLLSNNDYSVKVTYTYDLNDGVGTQTLIKTASVKTLAKAVPSFEIENLVPTQTSFVYEINLTDSDKVGAITKIELLHGNDDPVVVEDLTSREFTGLLSNNDYSVKVTYTYDLNDGVGRQTLTKTASVKTVAKAVPSFTISEERVTDTAITASYTMTDPDGIGSVTSVALYKGDDLILTNEDKKIAFSDLDSYTAYRLVIAFSYDAGDGKDTIDATYENAYRTTPYVAFTSCKVANTSAVSEGETIYLQASIENPNGATCTGVVVNGRTYGVVGTTTAKKVFVEIVSEGQFEGGDTVLTVEKLLMTLDGVDYVVTPANENNSDHVFINGKLELLSVDYVDAEGNLLGDWVYPDAEVYVMMTLKNPTDYTIDKINDSAVSSYDGFTKLDENRYVWQVSLFTGANSVTIRSLEYHNDYGSKTVNFKTVAKDDIFCTRGNKVVYVSTPADLKNMNDGYHYVLTQDIDLGGIDWSSPADFCGVFDGNGHSVKNMSFVGTVKNRSTVSLGLFGDARGFIFNLDIKNALYIVQVENESNDAYITVSLGAVASRAFRRLVIDNCTMDEESYISVTWNEQLSRCYSRIGGILGEGSSDPCVIKNCTNAGVVTGAGSYVGGICGAVREDTFITNCTNAGVVTGAGYYVGGICGDAAKGSTIENCMNSGGVSGGKGGFGGICGNTNGNVTITNCTNSGDISASSSDVGGICGSGSTITDCANTGSVTGASSNVGGICGTGSTITNCTNEGDVSGSSYVGGISGIGGTITNCTNTGDVSGCDRVGGICGSTNGNVTITNCTNSGNVSGRENDNWDISNFVIGGICGSGSQIMYCTNSGDVSGGSWVGGICGSGAAITKCTNTGNVSGNWGVAGICGSVWGDITNCTNTGAVTGTDSYVGGICGSASYTTIDVGMDNIIAIMNCANNGDVQGGNFCVGAICGGADMGSTIENCTNSGDISGSSDVGGISGIGGTITNCTNTGDVSGCDRVGGICGSMSGNVTITNCTNSGNVSGRENANWDISNLVIGGICGSGSQIMYCTNSGDVSGGSWVGGICGSGAAITKCTNTGNVSGNWGVAGICGSVWGDITNCTNTGAVTGTDSYVGGICGSASYTTIDVGMDNIIAIMNCANNGDVQGGNFCVGAICGGADMGSTIENCTNSGDISASADVGGICGEGGTITNCYDFATEPDEKMNDKSFYTEVLGWDEEIWDLDDLDVANGKVPKLK